MLSYNLRPRLNYNYSLSDFLYSLFSLVKNRHQRYSRIYKLFDSNKIYFTNHGRTGLRLILNSSGLKENARIGVQAYTCHTVFQAITKAGYRPYFIDINDNFTMDINDLKRKVDKINALIVTHTFGIPADFDEIKKIASNIPIIEDCAHSFLSEYKGKLTGTLGDASFFSFGLAKFPSIGNGGFILINNERLINKLEEEYSRLPNSSFLTEIKNILKNLVITVAHKKPFYRLLSCPIGKKLDKKFDFGGKFEFNEAKALVTNLSLFLKKFDSYNKYYERQRENAKYLISNMENKFDFIEDSEPKKINYFLLPTLSNNRGYIIKKALEHGIELGKHFSNSIQWAKNFGYKERLCPNAEKIVKEILTIPCHYNLRKETLNKIICILRG